MTENVSDSELNKMAEIDGESPFSSAVPDPSTLPDHTVEALVFSLELKRHLVSGIASEATPHEWIDMVQSFELPIIDQSSDRPTGFNSGLQKFRDALFNFFQPKFALGGAVSAALVAGIFFQTQTVLVNAPSSAWTGLYASIDGAPALSKQYDSDFSGSFFVQPSVNVRSNQNDDEFMLYSESSYEDLALTVRAMELEGEEFGRITNDESFVWIAIRGELAGPSAEKSECKLLQVTPSSKETPDFSNSSTFLQYCPNEWSKKITLLGST